MLECPICRRSYEGRFQVFVPPHHEAFDTVACAQRAAEAWGWDKAAPAPVILPTIEAVRARSEAQVASVARRRGVALAGFEFPSGQAALATGVGLLAAGAAASIYLGFRPGETAPPHPIAAGAPTTRQTIDPPPTATRPAPTGPPLTGPAAQTVSRAKFIADTGRSVGTASGTREQPVLGNSPSGPAASPAPAESPVGSPAPSPKPPPSTPKAPPVTPVTPKPPDPSSPPPASASPPVNPAGLAEATSVGGGGIGEAGNPSPQSPPAKPPPPPSPPPPSPPPQTTTPSDQSDPEDEGDDDGHPSDTRPGNGWGDENHEHTGPPGQGNHGNGGGSGNSHDHGR